MVKLGIAQYNIFCRPSFLFRDAQDERARQVVGALQKASNNELDVICLCECFDDDSKKCILDSMTEHGFKYFTETVGHDKDEFEHLCFENRLIVTNGGVCTLSKHPILETDSLIFDMSEMRGSDTFALKGVMYAKIKKEDKLFHVFNTHLIAWTDNADLRRKQVHLLHRFINSKKIPDNEAVIVAGDLNECYIRDKKHADRLLDTLSASIPEMKLNSLMYTCDNQNSLVGRDSSKKPYVNQVLDYVLIDDRHTVPKKVSMIYSRLLLEKPISVPKISCVPLPCFFRTKQILDISDHNAVIVKGEW